LVIVFIFILVFTNKKETIRSPFYFLSFFNQDISPHRSLAAISAGRRGIACTGLAAGGLVASPVATLVSDGTVAGQRRLEALAATALGLGFATAFRRHQAVGAVADHVALTHLQQGLADHRPAGRVVITQQQKAGCPFILG